MIGDFVVHDGFGLNSWVLVVSGSDRARWPVGMPAFLVELDPVPGSQAMVLMIAGRLWTGSCSGLTLTPISRACRHTHAPGTVEP